MSLLIPTDPLAKKRANDKKRRETPTPAPKPNRTILAASSLFPVRLIEDEPRAFERNRQTHELKERTLIGSFARVTVSTAQEWRFLTMLEYGVDRFTPVAGNGQFVRLEKLP